MKYLFFSIVIIFFSCKNDTKKEIEQNQVSFNSSVKTDVIQKRMLAANESFEAFYSQFIQFIKDKNNEALNQHIHPDLGLWVIESPGAVPVMHKFYSIEQFIATNKKLKFINLPLKNIDNPLLFEELPTVICEDNIYNKNGVFANSTNTLNDSRIWNYAGLNEKQIQEIEYSAEKINYTVVNTYNYVFFFSKIDNQWYISFIDLRIPCVG